ncbi:hypothetical protein [Brachyspira hyodysenteriae]|uniref:hypothetical protein n=1 Tax=Brachyspira hyodysenteriae TaxID=159 RepID=UPI003A7F897D
MQKQIKFFLTLLTVLILAVSCAKNNPNDPNNNNGSGIITTVYYGSKSIVVNTADQDKLKELWIGLVKNQFIYYATDYAYKSGKFDSEGNYHDISSDYQNPKPEIRTKYIKNIAYQYNGNFYLAGIYWDNENQGMPNAYRLIAFDDKGAELAWFGGGSNPNNIPNENTVWTRYKDGSGKDAIWGYIEKF